MYKTARLWLTLTFAISFVNPEVFGQVATDTIKKYEEKSFTRVPFYKSKGFRATIAPAILIGYGLSTIKDNGIYSSYDLNDDLRRKFPNFHTKVDDILIYVPFAELVLAYALQQESNHDFLNTGLLILKAEAINAVTVFGLKRITKQVRPNGEKSNSLPSGHTAHAFLAASIIHSELRHRSHWYGIGAYTIATSVGALRMLNNKHWQSDVFTGAGIGILSSHLAYLSHRNRWGRKPTIAFSPAYIYGAPGIGLSVNLSQVKSRKFVHPVAPEKKPSALPIN